MRFSDKVKRMSAAEIIMAMVKGLENPSVKVDMHTFGTSRKESLFFGLFKKDVCYGCAATNTICKIANVKFNRITIQYRDLAVNEEKYQSQKEKEFIYLFERAIDELRRGSISDYNILANAIDIAIITNKDSICLPYLDNNYTRKDLGILEQLAKSQDQ